MAMTCGQEAKTVAVVPSLGRSPHLVACLEALRRDAGREVEIRVVHQGPGAPPETAASLADRVLASRERLGFAAAVNWGLEATIAPWIAVLNDDALVEPGWLAALRRTLEADPRAAAAQGVNLLLESPHLADGCALVWNRYWQALQRYRGRPPPGPDDSPHEVFGVSATAALFRASSLRVVAAADGEFLDSRLDSYYEDVDLACRIRERGWTALCVPIARALHAPSTTGSTLGAQRFAWIYGNRLLVLARLFGRTFWPRLPWLLIPDLRDLARAWTGGQHQRRRGILSGWGRAVRLLSSFARCGAPTLPVSQLRRFQASP